MSLLLTILLLISSVLYAHANCVTFDLIAWTPQQRSLLNHVIAVNANEGVTLRIPDERQPDTIEACTPIVDISTLSLSTLQASTQTLIDAHTTAASDRQALIDNARNRVRNNNVCTATFADVESRIEVERASIAAAITASSTIAGLKTATVNGMDKYATIITKTLECILGRAVSQGQGG